MASSEVSAQLQGHNQPAVATASSSALAVEATDPPATFTGALEAMQQTGVPGTPLEASTEAPAPVRKGKGVGKRLTDRQRVEILELLEKSNGSLSNADIARRYGITRAAIQKLKQKGPEVRARYRYGSTQSRDERRRGGHILSVPFERELFEWVKGLKTRKVPVPPSLVKEKAKLLVPKYGLGNFQASNGWYYNFCKRFNLSTGLLVGEQATIEEPDAGLNADHAQLTINALQQQYEQTQYQPIAPSQQEQVQEQPQPPQQPETTSDRVLTLLEQQNTLLERQNKMIEEQAETIKKLFDVVTQRGAEL